MIVLPLNKVGELQPLQRGQDIMGSEVGAFGSHLPTYVQKCLNP